ncbi:hypothetical protein GXP71_12115 [Cellulomonas sp. H30R-01]|uniref:hypothetical protein n=1 Tax=Cellulomonas sp. H30R-01 TaxID=2704467 RepID=UPI00138BCDB3|nr:hypothetical protein [Cellulomonas sp. H30R-01]QHT56751.1 hypothetical protein GXP71_12115 [Cellulomonas sp. H30R-01]
MTRDLSHELRDLAARHARTLPDGGLAVAALTRRARRRRRARATALTVGSAAVVVVVAAAGALALRPAPRPAPAHTPSPSASATPAPSASATPAVALPHGDPTAEYGTCGALVDATPTGGFAASWTTTVEIADDEVAEAGALAVDAALAPPDAPATIVGYPESGPRFSVVRDGVVVAGGTDLYLGADLGVGLDPVYSEGDDTVAFTGRVDLAVCDPGDGSADVGAALPPGRYTLVAWTPVVDLGTDSWPDAVVQGTSTNAEYVAQAGLTWVVAAGPAVPFSVLAGDAPVAQAPVAGAPPAGSAPTCGDPAPAVTRGPLHLDRPAAPPSEAQVGEVLEVALDLRYDGPGRFRLHQYPAALVISQEGVVVGSTVVQWDGMTRVVDLGSGQPRHETVFASLTGCSTEFGEPGTSLPAGTYLVHPVVDGNVGWIWTSESGAVRPGGSTVAVGEPFTVTVR